MKTASCLVIFLIFNFPDLLFGQVVQSQRFVGLFEPSAVVQLSSGLVLIAEDEGRQPLTIFSIQSEGKQLKLIRQKVEIDMQLSLDDLEGGAIGKNGEIFFITSHSRSGKGKKRKKRERLVRFGVKGSTINNIKTYGSLSTDIEKYWQRFSAHKLVDMNNLNIEALAFQEDLSKLFIGLRAPLNNGRSNLLLLKNPYAILKNKEMSASFESLISLDIGGGGIRAMTFDKIGRRFLLANEIPDKKDKLRLAVWEWSGKKDDTPLRLRLPKIKGVKNIEGMAFVTSNSGRYLLMVCDDGNRKKQKGAHYVFLKSELLNK